jgi:hypothetical protein
MRSWPRRPNKKASLFLALTRDDGENQEHGVEGDGTATYPIEDRNPREDPQTADSVCTLGEKT